jgi:hypothetical protein
MVTNTAISDRSHADPTKVRKSHTEVHRPNDSHRSPTYSSLFHFLYYYSNNAWSKLQGRQYKGLLGVESS